MKRFLCLLIAIIIICLPACSKKNTESKDNPPESSSLDTIKVIDPDTDSMKKTAVRALNTLSDTVLPEKGITVFSATDMPIVPESEGTVYSYTLAQRNRMFEKKYSTTLNQFTEESDKLLEQAHYNMLAGIGFADLFTIPAKDLHKYAQKGVLLNTASLPGADYSADWFDKDLMERAAHGNESYAVYGDFNKDISSYYCLYVNRDLLASADIKTPYTAVKNGSWTWDSLLEITRNFSAKNEAFAISVQSDDLLANVCFKSAGYDYITTAHKATPTVSFASDSSQLLLQSLRNLYTQSISDASEAFTSGNSLFYIGTVGEMNKIKFLQNDWCILPIPKAAATQENYITYMDENHSVLTCYAGASNASLLFYAVEGLNAASYGGYLTEAYYSDLVLNSLRDSDTLNMLDYICGVKDGVLITDFTDYYAPYFPVLYEETVSAVAKAAKGDTLHIFNVEENAKKELEPILSDNF